MAAQSPELHPDSWLKKLSDPGDKYNAGFNQLDSLLLVTDSVSTFLFLNELLEIGKKKGNHFQARFNCIKSRQLYNKNLKKLPEVKEEVKQLFSRAIHEAYQSDDDYLIAFVSLRYGGLIYHFGELELAVMYSMNGVELYEKLAGENTPQVYQSLSDLLYKIKEYRESVAYSHKAIHAWENTYPGPYRYPVMLCMNTVALGYHRQNMYDSALIFYNKSLQLADKIKNEVWKGIISGNMGQVYYQQQKYDSALALLSLDYRTSKAAGYYDNAANSLQWAARTELAKGNKSTALAHVRESLQLLQKRPDLNYLNNTYFAAVKIFEASGSYDSALHYNKLYTRLNDSLERVIIVSSLAISKARMNDEKSRYSIQNLQKEKNAQALMRNIIISGVLLLAVLALLVVNSWRIRSKHRLEKIMQDKLMMEQEMASAKSQLKMFTQNIIEKTVLIESLEQRAKNQTRTAEHQQIITQLSAQTILTEEDWEQFKALFEKIYPGFFINLKEKVMDITIAEQRMAALSRLHLTARQMAAILGISVDSVHKSRQRLRLRLQLASDINMEEYLANL